MSDSKAWVDQECPTPLQWPKTRAYILRRTETQDVRIRDLEESVRVLASVVVETPLVYVSKDDPNLPAIAGAYDDLLTNPIAKAAVDAARKERDE